jgi:hypothetical protein
MPRNDDRNQPRRRKLNPPLDPATAQGINEQKGLLLKQFGFNRENLKTQEGILKAGFKSQAGAIQQQFLQDLAGTEGAWLGRGLLGSSADIQQRLAVRANKQTALQEAKNILAQGMLSLKAQGQQSRLDLSMGLANLAAARAAAQQNALAQQYMQGAFDRSGGVGGGGGRPGGGGPGGGGGDEASRRGKVNFVERMMGSGLSGNWRPVQLNRVMDIFSNRRLADYIVSAIGLTKMRRWYNSGDISYVPLRNLVRKAIIRAGGSFGGGDGGTDVGGGRKVPQRYDPLVFAQTGRPEVQP